MAGSPERRPRQTLAASAWSCWRCAPPLADQSASWTLRDWDRRSNPRSRSFRRVSSRRGCASGQALRNGDHPLLVRPCQAKVITELLERREWRQACANAGPYGPTIFETSFHVNGPNHLTCRNVLSNRDLGNDPRSRFKNRSSGVPAARGQDHGRTTQAPAHRMPGGLLLG
jgi:hypothetical protein